MTKYERRVIGSTDVYSRKHIDRQFDRLDRLRSRDKERIRELEQQVAALIAWKTNLQRVGAAIPDVNVRIRD